MKRRLIHGLAVVVLLLGALAFVGKQVQRDARAALAADGTGSWWFPRGGPYILGFESPGPASLAIDGEVVVSGSGLVTKRLLYDTGVHAVAFTAPPGARLLWHPPGRRGALEYVLPSSLSPDPPAQAELTSPGTDQASAAVAIGALLVLVWFLVRSTRPFADGRIYGPGVAVFVVALFVRVYGLSEAGQTWDEDEYWSAGLDDVKNALAGDTRPESWRWNHEHPPVTKYIAGAGALAEDGFGAARLIFAALGAGACVLTFASGRRLFGARAGFFAGMTAALLPHLVAHSRVVGHETPSVFFATLAVWLALMASQEDGERPGWLAARFVGVGIAFGLAVGTRFTNLLIAPVIAAAALLPVRRGTFIRTAVLGFVVILLAAAATVIAIWPLLWHEPVARLQAAWQVLRAQHMPEMYLGKMVQQPPWHYFPVYLLATTPLLVLIVAVVGGGARAAFRRERAWLLLLVWLLAPFGVVFSPVRQDGVRYILPALVPLALVAGAGLDLLLDRAASVAFIVGLLYVSYLGFVDMRIFPYYLDYYGEQVGGTERVAERGWFEVGWWGEGIADGVGYVNRHAAQGAAVARLVMPNHVTWFRGDLWPKLGDRLTPEAEWAVVNDMGARGFAPPADLKLVHDVKAGGASIVRVYHREAAEPPGASKRP